MQLCHILVFAVAVAADRFKCSTIALVVVVAVVVVVVFLVVVLVTVFAWKNGTGDWHLGLGAAGKSLRG